MSAGCLVQIGSPALPTLIRPVFAAYAASGVMASPVNRVSIVQIESTDEASAFSASGIASLTRLLGRMIPNLFSATIQRYPDCTGRAFDSGIAAAIRNPRKPPRADTRSQSGRLSLR